MAINAASAEPHSCPEEKTNVTLIFDFTSSTMAGQDTESTYEIIPARTKNSAKAAALVTRNAKNSSHR
jgi:hypothetical protein